MARRRRWTSSWNLPNALTCLRIVLTALFIWLATIEGPVSSFLALAVFGLASLTDWLDGYLARKLHQYTPFGIFMDPFADKVLVISALLVFLWENIVSVWIVIIIVARESIVTSIRVLAEARGLSLGAIPSGKQKMVSQIIAILCILAIIFAQYAISSSTGIPWDTALARSGPRYALLARAMAILPNLLLFVTMVFSVVSGVEFVHRHRRLFIKR